MSTSGTAAPILWPDYLSYQQSADPEVLNSRAFGRDEQLSEILNRIESGEPISEEAVMRLDRNRARKFRQQRKKLLEVYATFDQVASDGSAAFDAAVESERLAWVRANSTELEFHCLWLFASGLSYEEIGRRLSKTSSALRTLVSRCRTRLQAAHNEAMTS